jgi:putative sigma-54 modulation protein
MTVNFQYVNIDTSEWLSKYTQEKLNTLSDKYQFLISAKVFFKEDRNEPVNSKICNIQLSLPGPQIFATSNEKNYEMAVKETISDLERQLKKRKEVFKTF